MSLGWPSFYVTQEIKQRIVPLMKTTTISQFVYKGQDIDVLVNKGKISYMFEYKGGRYGNGVKVKGRTQQAVVDAAFNLLINLMETYDAVCKKG